MLYQKSILPAAGVSAENGAGRKLRRRGFTMAELMIIIVVLGLLTAVAVPVYNNVRRSATDNVKIQNADMLNQMISTVYSAGVDISGWTDASAAITALRAGVLIHSVDPRAATQEIRLQRDLNPAAYTLSRADATSAPVIVPNWDAPDTTP